MNEHTQDANPISTAGTRDDSGAERVPHRIARYVPFPVNCLPDLLRQFVTSGAAAIGCDASYIALPLLTVIAAAIGNSRRLRMKRGWDVPSVLWTAIVGESGSAKTPAFKLALRPIHEIQRRAMIRHAEQMKEYAAELAFHERSITLWKRSKDSCEPPSPPPEPVCERFVVSDSTRESLAPILLQNPRGVLLSCDELAGWLGSFDKYSGKGGGDSASWLSMHSAEQMIVDRKTGDRRTIYVPRAAVSIAGGIQPAILHRALGQEHRESGLAARLLLACPPRQQKRWSEADISDDLETKLALIVGRLYDLKPEELEDGDSRPRIVELSLDAKSAFAEFYDVHAAEQADLTGDLAAAWSKLEEAAARLALVIHFARWAAGDDSLQNPDILDGASMEAGICLCEWFKGETRRVYGILSESDESRNRRRLIEWIERKGGTVTTRDVQRGCHRWLGDAAETENALNDLANAGDGHWREIPSDTYGGRPTRVFVLATALTVTEPQNTRDSEGFVTVTTGDTPTIDNLPTASEKEWWKM